ncbi:flagellar brake protein [Bacillaceae bacterium W0354]
MFVVGMRITIETLQNGIIQERFSSKLVEITKQKLYIDYPINEKTGKTALLIDGSEIQVSFIAQDGNIYKYHTHITGRKMLNNLRVLLVKRPTKDQLHKIQRREYVRIDVALDVALYPLDESKCPLITRTRDISGGGMAVEAFDKLDEYESGDEMEVTIVLPFDSNDYTYIKATAQVIRCIYNDKSSKTGIITYKFTKIDDQLREKIIKFCFVKQLEIRKSKYNMR